MNSLQITYFLDAAECKNFSAAAKKQMVSQPAISRVISDLEKELGTALFERKKSGVKLTYAGEIYYELFCSFREKLWQAKHQIAEHEDPARGMIRIGIPSNFDVSDPLGRIREKVGEVYPHIQIRLVICRDFSDIFRRLKEGELDGAITIDDTLHRGNADGCIELEQGKRILIFSKKHPLAKAKDLSPKDFKDETFLVLDKDGVGAQMAREYCRPYGFEPKMVSAEDIEALVMGVQNVEGVAMIDPWMRIRSNTDFGYIEMKESSRLLFVWKKENKNPAFVLVLKQLEGL